MKKFILSIALLITAVSALAAKGSPNNSAEISSWMQQIINQRNTFTLMLPATEELNKQYLYLSDWGKNDDSIIFKLFLTALVPEDSIMSLVHRQRPDGTWPDINYADTKLTQWEPYNHCTNIYVMAKAYKTPGSKVYNSPEVAAAIHKALNFWFRADLKCPNWWQNEIGVGRMLGPVVLLLRDELSKEELEGGIRVLDNSSFKQTGQNKVWQASNVCIKALLLNDEALVRRCRDTIFSELRAVGADGPAVEGLQPDWSFHQHGPQLQLGNYGMSFAIVQAEWAQIFRNTPVALDKKREDLLVNYIANGLQWVIWRGNLDMNASGRQLARNTHRAKAYSLALGVEHLLTVRPGDDSLKAFLDRNIFHKDAPNDLVGFKFFPRSDYGVMRTPSWFASVRMHSDRTIGFETTAGDNSQGIFCADGTLIIMRDGTEYENIAPVWDWKRLPGVTVADNGKPIPFRPTSDHSSPKNKSDFVGGLRSPSAGAGNGTTSACEAQAAGRGEAHVPRSLPRPAGGVMAMELVYENRFEHKAYFIDYDGVLALGAGIKVDSAFRTTTGIEQNNLKGEVTYSVGGKVSKLGKEQETTLKNPQWLYHNNTGYILLQPANVVVSNKTRSGNWQDISRNDIDKVISKPVFKAYIDHGVQPLDGSYAWFVAPGAKQRELTAMSARIVRSILINTKDLQAVMSGGVVRAVFWKPGTLTLPDKSTITTSEAIIMQINTLSPDILVADPTQKLEKVDITLGGALRQTFGDWTQTITISLGGPKLLRGNTVAAKRPFSSKLTEGDVKAVANAVADWHIANLPKVVASRVKWKQGETNWADAVLVNAVADWSGFAGTKAQTQWYQDFARRNYYQPGPRMYVVDDIFICPTYATIYNSNQKFEFIAPTVARLDFQINHPATGSLIFGEPGATERWTWCDVLYLGPAIFFRYALLMHDDRYVEFGDKSFWKTYNVLYDKDEHLFYRDTRYKSMREANGQKVFWGRGNGWVIGGLANLLTYLPKSHPSYQRYVALFNDMAARLIALQGKDGYWRSSLLDPDSYPAPETSATAMIGQALWWGINNGMLDKKTYLPAAQKSWEALVKAVSPDGMLGWVQAIGADPKSVNADMTESYGAGAMITEAQQILLYLQGKK